MAKHGLIALLTVFILLAAAVTEAALSWQQANISGFGNPQAAEVTALEVFNGGLYAGIANFADGAQVFRWKTGTAWEPVSQAGFGIFTDTRPRVIMDLAVFRSYLYAGTGLNENAGQIWRTANGTTWAPVVIAGFSDPDTVDISALCEYNGSLYAGATNRINGAQIWRSTSGDNNTWTQDGPSFPGANRATITGFAIHAGSLYAAVDSDGPVKVLRRDLAGWSAVVSDGFGSTGTTSAGGLAEFGGYLFAGAGNTADGAQLWRTPDGASWTQVLTPGLGDENNVQVEAVFVFQNQLHISTKNSITGMELWRSSDGVVWEQINTDGFGDANNSGANRSNAVVAFQGLLYAGTANAAVGGEVWRGQGLANRIHLPVIVR